MSAKMPDGAASPNSANCQLSWQSAFFGLMGLITPVLLQNAGIVGGINPSYRVSLRSSPIVCSSDTLLVLIQWVWMTLSEQSFSKAAKYTWYARYNRPDLTEGAGVNSQWRWSMIFFIIGSGTQCVKLFACKGIEYTQAIVGCYLASFIVMEALRMVAGTPHTEVLADSFNARIIRSKISKLQTGLMILSCSIQFVLWIWILRAVVPPDMWFIEEQYSYLLHTRNNLSSFKDTVLILGQTVIIPFLVQKMLVNVPGLDNRLSSRAQRGLEYTLSALYMLFYCTWLFRPVYDRDFALVVERVLEVLRVSFGSGFLLATMLLFYTLYSILCLPDYAAVLKCVTGLDANGSDSEFMSIFFAIANFSTLLIYYSCVYSAEGTYKPLWTEKLG